MTLVEYTIAQALLAFLQTEFTRRHPRILQVAFITIISLICADQTESLQCASRRLQETEGWAQESAERFLLLGGEEIELSVSCCVQIEAD